MLLLPVYGEAAFDSTMWYYGKDDKPWSTYIVRPILFLMGGLVAYWLGDKEWWRIAFVMGAAFLAWFPLLINWIRDEKASYLGKNWWDRLMAKFQPAIFRIWFFIWLWITALCVYYYYELYINVF